MPLRLHAYAFALEVERQIESLSLEEFHLRRGRGKLLQEEWYPIARLGLHLKQPGLQVEVEAYDDKGVADGRIFEKGFRDRAFDIQVTYVHDYEEALRRELMVKQGYAPGAGPISRDKKTGNIVATTTAVDIDFHVRRVADSLAERFEKKTAHAYPADTALMLAFEDMQHRGRGYWQELFELLDLQVKLSASNFQSVFVLNCATNELHQAA